MSGAPGHSASGVVRWQRRAARWVGQGARPTARRVGSKASSARWGRGWAFMAFAHQRVEPSAHGMDRFSVLEQCLASRLGDLWVAKDCQVVVELRRIAWRRDHRGDAPLRERVAIAVCGCWPHQQRSMSRQRLKQSPVRGRRERQKTRSSLLAERKQGPFSARMGCAVSRHEDIPAPTRNRSLRQASVMRREASGPDFPLRLQLSQRLPYLIRQSLGRTAPKTAGIHRGSRSSAVGALARHRR